MDLSGILPTVGGTPDPQRPSDMFASSVAAIPAARDAVVSAGSQYADLIKSAQQVIPAAQAAKAKNLAEVSDAVGATGAAITDASHTALDRAKPIFATQTQIDARRQELLGMNPLKRAVLGLVNPMYNEDHLNKLHDANSTQLSDIAGEYSTTVQENKTLADTALQGGDLADKTIQLQIDGMTQSLGLASESLSASRSRFLDTMQGITAAGQITETQHALAASALDSLTPQNIASAVASAKKTGFATIGGAQIPIGMLNDRQNQLRIQALSLEEHAVSLAAGKIGLANAADDRFVNAMSPTERQIAANAGGVFQGRKLPADSLARAINADTSVQANMAQLGSLHAQASQAMPAMDAFLDMTHKTVAKLHDMFGDRVPAAMTQFMGQTAQTINTRAQAIANIKDPEAKAREMASFYNEISGGGDPSKGWLGKLDSTLDKVTGSFARTPAARATFNSFLTGQRQSTGDMVAGTIDLIRQGGLPPGVKGPDAAIFSAGQKAYGDATLAASRKGLKGKDAEAFIQQAVGQQMETAYTNVRGQSLLNSIPNFAKSIGHPAGNIDPNDWKAAQAAGDVRGMQTMADQLGLSVSDAKTLFNPADPHQGQVYSRISGDGKGGIKQGRDMETLQAQLASAQHGEAFHALDTSPSARPGFVPSRAIADLMSSGKWQDAANHHLDNTTNSFGGYLLDGVGGAKLRSNIATYGQFVANQSIALHASEMAEQGRVTSLYGNPVRRMGAILGSMQGIDQHHEQVLLQQLAHAAQTAPPGMSQDDAMVNMLKGGGGRFQDPALEKVRQIAAKSYDDHARNLDSAMDRLKGKGLRDTTAQQAENVGMLAGGL